jgi:Heterokaryon incompatibility protein (HET)
MIRRIHVSFRILSDPAGEASCDNLLNRSETDNCANTSSNSIIRLAETWIERCRTSHQNCVRNGQQISKLPTRLIDVHSLTSEGWCLQSRTNELHQETRYITLSHRWGQGEFLLLTNSTRPSLEAGTVPLSHLPKTFVDAISVVRKLNIRYIWIDSLCIQQDSLDDWRKESAKMRHVYSNSYCNIAAADAVDPNSGLFFDRDIATINPCMHENISNKVMYIVFNTDFWVDNVERGSLASRAWVLQERLLARHTLYFGREQVFWECAQLTASESYPNELLSTIFDIRQPTMKVGNPLFSTTASNSHIENYALYSPTLDDLMAFWRRVVNSYARCELTKADDKLVAIAGIASQLAPKINRAYYTGLWNYNMISELMWSISGGKKANGEPSVRPKGRKVPTWSWASVDGLVRCNDIDFKNQIGACPLAEVDSVIGDSGFTDLSGQNSPKIRLRGNLLPTSVLAPSGVSWNFKLVLGHDRLAQFSPDVPLHEALNNCFCLPLGHYLWPDNPKAPIVEGLVLLRCQDVESFYSRVGIFRAQSRETCQALGIVFPPDELLGHPAHGLFQQVLTLI